jgi:hypothetical protein
VGEIKGNGKKTWLDRLPVNWRLMIVVIVMAVLIAWLAIREW